MVILLMVVLLILIALSLWLRVRRYRNTFEGVDPRPTPFSLAVQELVATAGGVYLAIIALTSFLRLDIPEKITLTKVAVDPLAMLAIGVAVVQPILIGLFNKFK